MGASRRGLHSAKSVSPSVFPVLPKLLEGAGSAQSGSITGVYTVLVKGDDMTGPVADAVRSMLDGHIVLSRDLASRRQFLQQDLFEPSELEGIADTILQALS